MIWAHRHTGDFDFLKPFCLCTQAEIEETQKWIDETGEFYLGKNTYPKVFMDIVHDLDYYRQHFDAARIAEPIKGQFLYYAELEREERGRMVVYGESDTAVCTFTGTKQGEEWVMSADFRGAVQQLTFYPRYQKEVVTSTLDMGMATTDFCTLNREDGEELAYASLVELGYGDYELVNTIITMTTDENAKTFANGYVYTFARSIGGIPTAFLGRFQPTMGVIYYDDIPQEYVSIYVNQYGVEQIDLLAHYDFGNASKNEELLPFEQIDEKAQQEIASEINYIANQHLTIKEISLKYIVVVNEGLYSYRPVWVYHITYPDGSAQRYTTDICIDAISGEITNHKIRFDFIFNVVD